MGELHRGRTITFGIERKADVTAFEIEDAQLEIIRFGLRTPLGETRVELPLPGRHNLMNALAAAAVATCFDVAPDKIAAALSTAAPAAMRGEVLHFKNGFTVVDDSYNSNPRSLLSMVQALAAGGGAERIKRRIVVAGEMLELGDESDQMHRDVGRDIALAGVDFLWGVRGRAREILEGAREAGMTDEQMRFFEDSEAAGRALVEWAQTGDLILVKGSRGVKTDRVVKMLRESFETEDEVRDNKE